MKALVLTSYGDPETCIEYQTVPEPEALTFRSIISSNYKVATTLPSIFLLPNRHASQFHALSALRARASAD
jgi:hypothetical protein